MQNLSTGNDVVADYSLRRARRVGTIVLIVFVVLWVIALSGVNLFLRWSIEQSMFETEVGMNDGRWLVNLVCGIFLFIPLLALYFAVKIPRIRLMLRLWVIAAVFVLLSGPAKFLYLTAQNQGNILLAATLLLLTSLLLLLRKKQKKPETKLPGSGLMGTTVLVGVALTTPWILWGAFGSATDLVFSIFIAAAFAFFITQTVFSEYFSWTQPPGSIVSRGEYLFDGFTMMIFLFIMVSGLSQNGSQLLLTLAIPPAGWLLAALATAGRNRKNHGQIAVGVVAGLLLFLPLAFFDMDELALVIAGISEEVFYWANRAGWNTLIFLLAIAVVVLFLLKHIERANMDRRINIALIILSLIEILTLYLFAGQPGFFGDRVFVVMNEQVNTTQFGKLNASLEKRQELYTALTEVANNSQQNVRTMLEKRGIEYTPYYLVNGLEVNAGWLMKGTLEKTAGVDRVLDSPRLRPLSQPLAQAAGEVTEPHSGSLWNLEMINVPLVHEQLGITGEGIIIGQTDSGVDGSHPELKGSYRGQGSSNDYNWLDPWNNTVSPTDIGGHGTGTTAIITGETRGIAPDAEWMGCVNLARNLGNPALYLDCMQFMYAPYAQGGDPFYHGKPELGAMIINNSWGCPRVEGCDPALFEPAMNVLETAGIFMSVSAGNNGYYGCSTITDPLAIYEKAFSVGSVDKTGELSAFSSRGPVEVDGSARSKPDLLAPGEQVLVAAPGGTYSTSSGTSFSAPHVSGVVALMWSANPDLIGDIAATRKILMETAQPFTGRVAGCDGLENATGAGVLDAYAAVIAAIAVK